mgnify:CR=1 FL=1
MKHILVATFITLLALGTGCAWISPSSQTTSEGIQVHGHWNVTVSNPDGTVDAVHEFDNAYGGQGVITPLLAGLNQLDAHIIMLRHNSTMEFACEEQYSSLSTNNSFIYLEADFVIEYASRLPFTVGAFCTVIAGDGPVSLDGVVVYVVDFDAGICTYKGPSFTEPHCKLYDNGEVAGVTNPSWPSQIGYEILSGADSNIPVSNGQKLAINVQYSFE